MVALRRGRGAGLRRQPRGVGSLRASVGQSWRGLVASEDERWAAADGWAVNKAADVAFLRGGGG